MFETYVYDCYNTEIHEFEYIGKNANELSKLLNCSSQYCRSAELKGFKIHGKYLLTKRVSQRKWDGWIIQWCKEWDKITKAIRNNSGYKKN